jgi:hypothetical protein
MDYACFTRHSLALSVVEGALATSHFFPKRQIYANHRRRKTKSTIHLTFRTVVLFVTRKKHEIVPKCVKNLYYALVASLWSES